MIARSARLRNESVSPVCVKRLMSVQRDFDGGIHLKQAFAGHGYHQQMRFFTDFASRLYFMGKIETGGA